MCVNRETGIDYQTNGKSIDQEEQQVMLLGGNCGQASRYLVSHVTQKMAGVCVLF